MIQPSDSSKELEEYEEKRQRYRLRVGLLFVILRPSIQARSSEQRNGVLFAVVCLYPSLKPLR